MKACANELDTTQEKDEKGWRSIEKDYLEHFVLVWLRSAHIVVMKVDLLLVLFFPLFLKMLISVDKRGFQHAIDDEQYAFSYSELRVKHRTA